ncbi:MAG: nucleotidyltransferase, partial [Chloroflexi bacterium]|nr:nucleotidyltransferase [Chloroflexota bacterium]
LHVAAREIMGWLGRDGRRACVIGGLAVQRWGEPRLTRDVDLTLLVELGQEEELIDALLARFRPRRDDARAFALRYRVLLLRARNGVDLDVALGVTGFEVESIARASIYQFEPGCELPTCSAEDLIVHKTVAGRPRDQDDLVGIVNRQRGRLDLAYIRRWLTAFSEVDGMPDLLGRFEELLRAANATARQTGRRRPRPRRERKARPTRSR